MDTDQLEKFENRLCAEKQDVERDLALFSATYVPEQSEEEQYVKGVPLATQFAERLTNINAALAKMQKGMYGMCEICHTQIEIERLKITPEAQIHPACQEKG